MEKISTAFRKIFKEIGIENAVTVELLRAKWKSIFKDPIHKHTMPHALQNKCLTILVDSPEWLHELQFHQETILSHLRDLSIQRVRLRLGKIQDTPLHHSPRQRKRPLTEKDREFIENTVADVGDENLRDTIKKAIEKSIACHKAPR